VVRVHAASVNPADWYAMTGTPWVARAQMGLRKPKTRLGVDLAGVGTFAVQIAKAFGAEVTGVSGT
jgi:NADPH:quinone reductase-like Zn-dependent oxidoreductase